VLFAIEREINGVMPQERLRVRNERSRSLVVELERWLREQRARVSKNSETGKAIDYSLKRWSALTRFLDDGRLCMSNNAAERELRAIALGRRNWTFAGSDQGGRRAAAIYTLIATAKLNNVDPQAWLADQARCTTGVQPRIARWEHEDVLEAVQKRLDKNPQAMRVRRETVEHPFGTLKMRMGATHFLMKRLPKVATEMALHVPTTSPA
jgi:hypothetical protein